MPRKLIKERAFQEPIHPDAPGFNENQGHKDLITELNQEILPSWATDLIGPADATPDQNQFRVNVEGQLEYYFDGSWRLLRLGSGSGSYQPRYKADVVIESFEAKNVVASVQFRTKLSEHFYDIRAYQDDLPRVTKVRVGDTTADGTLYTVEFEAAVQPGQTYLELRYGDPNAGYQGAIAQRLIAVKDHYDASGTPVSGKVAFLDDVAARAFSGVVPHLASSDLAAQGWTSLNMSNDDGPGSPESSATEFLFVDPATGNLVTPWLNCGQFGLGQARQGDQRNRAITGQTNTIGFYRWSADWYYAGTWRKQVGEWNFYIQIHGPYGGNRTAYWDFVGVNRATPVVLFGTYHNSGDGSVPVYRSPEDILFNDKSYSAVTFGQTPLVFGVRAGLNATLVEQDIPLGGA